MREAADDVVAHVATAVQLERQRELAGAKAVVETRERIMPDRLLGQQRVAGKGDEFIDVRTEPVCELLRPRQTHQRDVGTGHGGAQRAQGGHRAQHVAQVKGAEYDHRRRIETLQQWSTVHLLLLCRLSYRATFATGHRGHYA